MIKRAKMIGAPEQPVMMGPWMMHRRNEGYIATAGQRGAAVKRFFAIDEMHNTIAEVVEIARQLALGHIVVPGILSARTKMGMVEPSRP